MNNKILNEDLEYIFAGLSKKEKEAFSDSFIVVTGCAGFLGYYLMHFFMKYCTELNIQQIIGLDNFFLQHPLWIKQLRIQDQHVQIHSFDVTKERIENIEGIEHVNLVIHLASIASPTFYRKYPLETLDANVWGLRRLLEHFRNKTIKGGMFFSSSEVYGDPFPEFIPTDEDYRGNVATIGPRACYDEAKRFGETLCYIFSQQYKMPIVIVRPFNNYGPGMSLHDKRVPADFAKAVFENCDIELFSDGSPTRTFCYVADAILGYLKALVYGKFECFNIGIEEPEISIRRLAEIYRNAGKEVFNYSGQIRFAPPPEDDYLTHNPNRRRPNINKAKKLLHYRPNIHVEEGVKRFLEFLKKDHGEL